MNLFVKRAFCPLAKSQPCGNIPSISLVSSQHEFIVVHVHHVRPVPLVHLTVTHSNDPATEKVPSNIKTAFLFD